MTREEKLLNQIVAALESLGDDVVTPDVRWGLLGSPEVEEVVTNILSDITDEAYQRGIDIAGLAAE